MKILRYHSIKKKIIGIVLLITMLILVLGFSFVIINDIKTFKKNLINLTLINARLIGEYCVAPLTFQDQSGAEEILNKLQTIPYVASAKVFDESNNLFASYGSSEAPLIISLDDGQEGFQKVDKNYIHIYQPIYYQSQKYGSIYIKTSTAMLYEKTRRYLLTMLILIVSLLILSYFLASKLQGVISNPVLALAKVTNTISKDGNYSVRVQRQTNDEIGMLYDGFNNMLEQIHIRENQRDRAAEALRESEARLMAIIDNTTALITLKDIEGRYILTNKRFESLFGITQQDIIGKTDFNIFPEQFATEFFRNDKKVIDVQTPVNFEESVPHNGDLHTYICIKFPLFDSDNSIYAICGISTDITPRIKAEEELKNTRNYLKNVFNSLPSMLISVNPDGIITQWNTAAEKYTGISANHALSQKIWDIIPFMKMYQDNFQDVVSSRTPKEFHRESNILSNEKKYLNISMYPLVYNGTDGAVIRIDDITELERKDEQLRQAQKMETVGNLAGGLAHDFNNVLGGILGTVSLIKYLLKEEKIEPGELENSIDIIEMSANRAADMVQQLLTLSRRHELKFAPVDLNTALKHVLKICQNTFDKGIEISVRYFPEAAMVKADPSQIEQVLLNLCVNAAHAMTIMREENEPQGGILSLSVDKIKNDSHFCRNHPEAMGCDYWIVRVQDTGVGMDGRTTSKIFDPFFTTKDKGKISGTGLGLAMVFNITQQHKGFVDVYSDLGVGSTFNIFLPVLEISNQQDDQLKEVEIPKGNGLIMIVDDEEIMRETARRILEECGYSVILAENGPQAIINFQNLKNEITAVLLDMAMPKLSGKDTYIKLKKINPNVKVLLASGFKQDSRVKDALELGVKGFIQKPFSMVDLAKKLKEIIEL